MEPYPKMEIYCNFKGIFKVKKKCAFFQRSISENSLVAMDFSGQKTRVIENPTEALSVAVEEGLAWRVQISFMFFKIFMI